jgi:hypothetical protein
VNVAVQVTAALLKKVKSVGGFNALTSGFPEAVQPLTSLDSYYLV